MRGLLASLAMFAAFAGAALMVVSGAAEGPLQMQHILEMTVGYAIAMVGVQNLVVGTQRGRRRILFQVSNAVGVIVTAVVAAALDSPWAYAGAIAVSALALCSLWSAIVSVGRRIHS